MIHTIKSTRKKLVRLLLILSFVGGGVLALAGSLTDPWLWMYLGVLGVAAGYGVLLLDEDVAQERFHPPSAGADAIALRFVQLTALAHLVVGALDGGRWHVFPVSPTVRTIALAGLAASAALVFNAMHTNRFFSSVVRIQHDRGHHVVDSGVYSRVRHPGYAGMIFLAPFSGLALGSWAAFAIAAIYSLLIMRRVVFEDAFLKANLPGYRDYAERVRYRLLPGLF